MTKILDGNILSSKFRKEISIEVSKIKKLGYNVPHLAIILVGENLSSHIYVQNKIKDCQDVGFCYSLEKLPYNISQDKLLKLIHNFNYDISIDGFIIQLPLPNHIDLKKIILAINPNKDVDCFHPMNIGKIIYNIETFLPATPSGILSLFNHYLIDIQGKDTVIIGRSIIIGRPMSILMSRKSTFGNSTVTLIHSLTNDIKKFTKKADIIITALGVPKFLKADMIQENSIIIDVGITHVKNNYSSKKYNLVGDVDFESVYGKASYLTPVPGGVGPLTRVMLLKNTLLAFKKAKNYI